MSGYSQIPNWISIILNCVLLFPRVKILSYELALHIEKNDNAFKIRAVGNAFWEIRPVSDTFLYSLFPCLTVFANNTLL